MNRKCLISDCKKYGDDRCCLDGKINYKFKGENMDRYEFMSEIKEVLDKFDNESLLKNKQIIKLTMIQILSMECQYAEAGIRDSNK